jgi:hypothetical protein
VTRAAHDNPDHSFERLMHGWIIFFFASTWSSGKVEADGAKACPVGGSFSLVRRNKLQKHFLVKKKNLLHVGNTSFFVQKLMKSLDCVHAPSRTKFSVLNHNNIHHIRVDCLNSITSAQANFLKTERCAFHVVAKQPAP